jgi:N-acetylmuramoyl-L-alanine amidase
MQMKIVNHKLVGVPFRQANAFGGEMVPTLACLHDTAGRLEKGSSVAWFCSKDCNTSAHVVIERDGSITQQVPFNRKAWHAGASSYQGKLHCNNFSIGIEIVNPGKLTKDGDKAKAWFGQSWPTSQLEYKVTDEHGVGWWMDYTPEQIAAVTELCKALAAAYPISDITTHWAITPGRKVDTNPLFPLERVKREVFAAATSDEPLIKPDPGPLKGSRIVATSSAGETVAVAGGVGGIGLSIADALGYGGQILPLIKSYGLEAFILVMLALAAGFAIVKHFRKQDHETGKTVQ